jgi:hypothetical protein
MIFLAGITGCARPSDTEIAKQIHQALIDSFGSDPAYKPPWYDSIQSVEVKGDTVLIRTSLTTDTESARRICMGTSGELFANNSAIPGGIENILILAEDGSTLVDRIGFSDRCE